MSAPPERPSGDANRDADATLIAARERAHVEQLADALGVTVGALEARARTDMHTRALTFRQFLDRLLRRTA